MRKVRRYALAAISFAVVVGASAIAPSAYATTGTLRIRQNRTLTEDHFGRVIIEANGVTLDCAGFRIVGLDAEGGQITGAGIRMTNRRNVTIRNCHIEGFDNGLLMTNSGNNTFTSNTVVLAAAAGCSLNQSNSNLFTRYEFTNNEGGGCELVGSSGNRFELGLVTDNADEGFDLEQSNNNALAFNTVSHNFDGFDLDTSNGNNIFANRVFGNFDNGIELDLSNDNLIDDNQSNLNGVGNAGNGITLDGSARNILRRNIADSNGRDGVRLSDFSNDNLVEFNAACHNTAFDGNMDSGTGNVFTGNNFCRTRGI
jgi:parallel beta-helix repeat protein